MLLNSQAAISDSTFSSNTAFEDGGVIYMHGHYENKSNLTVDNSTFSYNTATRHGGVVYASLATVMLNETVIGCNMAHLNGDLVYAMDSSKVIIANSNNYDKGIATNNLVYTDTSSNATTKDLVFATSSCDLIAEDILIPPCQKMLHHTMTNQFTNQQPITEASVDFNATSETLVQTEMPTKSESLIVPCDTVFPIP